MQAAAYEASQPRFPVPALLLEGPKVRASSGSDRMRSALRARTRVAVGAEAKVEAPGQLTVRTLKTETDRLDIAGLRQFAPLDAERDLDPSAPGLDAQKDAIGCVMALYLRGEPVATIRFVPFGHGLTLAEKIWCDATAHSAVFNLGRWEVGRLIVAPEHRRADLLPRYLLLALGELLRQFKVRHFHASCSPLMTRLYRRFGFRVEKIFNSGGGFSHALIHACADDVQQLLRACANSFGNSAVVMLAPANVDPIQGNAK